MSGSQALGFCGLISSAFAGVAWMTHTPLVGAASCLVMIIGNLYALAVK